ncbi:MAG: hypothetical protein AAFN93_16950 [Bacteroidota bacterium]
MNPADTISKRILLFIDYLGVSDRKFSEKVRLSHGTINAMRNKGTSLSSDKLERILDIFPQLDPVWLTTGSGDMLRVKKLDKVSNDGEEQSVPIEIIEERASKYLDENASYTKELTEILSNDGITKEELISKMEELISKYQEQSKKYATAFVDVHKLKDIIKSMSKVL